MDDPQRLKITLYYLLALAIAIPVHEYAHARSAVSYGDRTPERDGRLTLLPWHHFDPLGAVMCVLTALSGFGLGWGRPVLVNPLNFRNPHWDSVKCAAWGPLSNLLLATGTAALLRTMIATGRMPDVGLVAFLLIFLMVNLSLMLFNLIPIYPLDGSKILAGFLPERIASDYMKFMSQFGVLILLGLVFFGQQLGVFDLLIGEPRDMLLSWLLPEWFGADE